MGRSRALKSHMGASVIQSSILTNKREPQNTPTTFRSIQLCIAEEKISLNVSSVNPAWMVEVLASLPNFRNETSNPVPAGSTPGFSNLCRRPPQSSFTTLEDKVQKR